MTATPRPRRGYHLKAAVFAVVFVDLRLFYQSNKT
jgi:hypothetical protein